MWTGGIRDETANYTANKKDVQALCRKPYCTNSKLINVTEQEVKEMKAHLETLYSGEIQMNFAEKIVERNKEW